MMSAVTYLRDERGAAAAEMALMIPLLLILMFGGFEAGHYFYQEQKIIKAVREGARYAGRLPFSNFQCGSATDGAATTQIQHVTRSGLPDASAPSRIGGMVASDVTVSHRCDATYEGVGIFRGTTGGAPIVLVEARTSYNSLFEQLGLIDSSAIIQASAEAVVNGI